MVEAMRHAFVDRNSCLGDPDFVHNPLDQLLSNDHAASDPRNDRARPRRRRPHDLQPVRRRTKARRPRTTRWSTRHGNAVAVTYTINACFGAKVIAGDTGFFLNDEMDDFTAKPGAPNVFGLVQGKPTRSRRASGR